MRNVQSRYVAVFPKIYPLSHQRELLKKEGLKMFSNKDMFPTCIPSCCCTSSYIIHQNMLHIRKNPGDTFNEFQKKMYLLVNNPYNIPFITDLKQGGH